MKGVDDTAEEGGGVRTVMYKDDLDVTGPP